MAEYNFIFLRRRLIAAAASTARLASSESESGIIAVAVAVATEQSFRSRLVGRPKTPMSVDLSKTQVNIYSERLFMPTRTIRSARGRCVRRDRSAHRVDVDVLHASMARVSPFVLN